MLQNMVGYKDDCMKKENKVLDSSDFIDDIIETFREALHADRKGADVEGMFQQLKLKLRNLKEEERKKIKKEMKEDVIQAVMFGQFCDLEKRLNKLFD